MQEKFYENIDARFMSVYSRGGSMERSFWNNVGKIVNKKAIFERSDEVYKKIDKKLTNIGKEK